MVWMIPSALGVLFLVVFVVAFYVLYQRAGQSQQTSMEGTFRLLQDSFERLERSQESKTATLRSELSNEMQNNRKELQLGLMQTTQSLEGKFGTIDQRLDLRLKELTTGVQTKLEDNLKEGFRHFEKVQEHLKRAETQLLSLNTVGQSINELNNLLKMPHLRGNFGEQILEQMLTDLLPGDAFELQYRIVPNSTERVDAVIKYPQCVLPIDSKFPREQVLPLFETNDPVILEGARKTLTEVMKTLGRQIKEKYIRPEHGTTDMALLFVPSETLYFEILRNPKLCDELGKYKVFAVSPNTLAVTLHAVAMARNYYELAKGVEKTISDVKKAQQHYENFERRFDEIGTALGKAQNAFSTAQTHLGRYTGAIHRLTGGPESLAEPSPPELSN